MKQKIHQFKFGVYFLIHMCMIGVLLFLIRSSGDYANNKYELLFYITMCGIGLLYFNDKVWYHLDNLFLAVEGKYNEDE